MPSLRDLRLQIKSVTGTQKITKAMELVAAAKMRRAQDRMLASRPYADDITSIMSELMRRTPEYKHPYLMVREVRKRCIILITADRGLAGALNSNNVRAAVRSMHEGGVPTSVVAIGRKASDAMRRLRRDLIAEVSNYGDRPTMADILPVLRVAVEHYQNGDVDQVDVVYARFVTAGRQQATVCRLLPVEPPTGAGPVAADFVYEPDPKDVLDALLPRYVESLVYQSVLENMASEQAARMVAMQNASDNAGDMIGDLTLTANKVRQSTVTTELMEIVGGAAALAEATP